MITLALVVTAAIVALFIGLCAGAGMTLAIHQREFGIYKDDMDEALEKRDAAVAQIIEAVYAAHQDLEVVVNQTSQLSDINNKILAALCKTNAADAFTISTSGLKH